MVTWQPRCVDVVGAVVVGGGVDVDPGGVGGQQVGAAVLVLVADLQRRGVLRLGWVVRRYQLQIETKKD